MHNDPIRAVRRTVSVTGRNAPTMLALARLHDWPGALEQSGFDALWVSDSLIALAPPRVQSGLALYGTRGEGLVWLHRKAPLIAMRQGARCYAGEFATVRKREIRFLEILDILEGHCECRITVRAAGASMAVRGAMTGAEYLDVVRGRRLPYALDQYESLRALHEDLRGLAKRGHGGLSRQKTGGVIGTLHYLVPFTKVEAVLARVAQIRDGLAEEGLSLEAEGPLLPRYFARRV